MAPDASFLRVESGDLVRESGIVHGGTFLPAGLGLSASDWGPCTDILTGKLAFALSVDIHSWTVDKLYPALGGEPEKVPFGDVVIGARAWVFIHAATHKLLSAQLSRLYASVSSSLGRVHFLWVAAAENPLNRLYRVLVPPVHS
jgi:hypothetical protein